MMNKLANDIAQAVQYKLACYNQGMLKQAAGSPAITGRVVSSRSLSPSFIERALSGAVGSAVGGIGGGIMGSVGGAGIGGITGLVNAIKNRRDQSLMTKIKRALGVEASPTLMGDIKNITSTMQDYGTTGGAFGSATGGLIGGMHGVMDGAQGLDRFLN